MTVIKRNRTWKNRSLLGYSLASRCTTDRLQVSLRTVTFCHGVLRSARFITAHYVSHFRRDRFLNFQKICHGVHGYPGVLRLPIPFPCVASRRFDHGCLKRGRHDRREHSVNAVLRNVYMSRVVRKPTLCKNKGADHLRSNSEANLRSNSEADQRLCFCYTGTIPSKSKISSL